MNGYLRTGLAIAAFMTSNALAVTVIDTRPANSEIIYFGETDTASYGQTFTVPAGDNRLDSFTLSAALAGGDATEFALFVMGWDGAKAVGPVLYESAMQTVSSPTMTDFTFNPGISLTPGGSYVAFVNTSNYFDGDADNSSMASIGTADVYSGGLFVFLNHANDFSAVTLYPWEQNWQGPGFDIAFRAEFSSAGVPDAGLSAGMLGLAAIALFGLRRRIS